MVTKSKTTSCALDPLLTRLVKEYVEELSPLLTYIINRSTASGEFPHKWKTALVVRLLKKAGIDLILNNYRCVKSPICVQTVVNQLCLHSECGFPLASCQSAYRAGHSTETALVMVHSDILLNMDQQKITQLVLIDLLSAFDTVDHDILLNIMNCTFGVSDTTLN